MDPKPVMAAFLILGMITCAAQTRHEDEPLCDQKGAKRVEITDDDAAILGFAIGHASLKDVQDKMGSARIERVSRDEESDVAICYVSPADGTARSFGSENGIFGVRWIFRPCRSPISSHRNASPTSPSTLRP
jgi:hypothetical protein